MKTDIAKELFFEQLRKIPIIQIACEKTGMSRATYYRLRASDRNFRKQSEEAMERGYEMINDLSEAQIVTLIKSGRLPAMALWLKHHHPRYGSKTRLYEPIATEEDLTPEEKKIVMEALALASGMDNKTNHEGNNPAISGANPGE